MQHLTKRLSILLGGLVLSLAAFTIGQAVAPQLAATSGDAGADVCTETASDSGSEFGTVTLVTNHWKRCLEAEAADPATPGRPGTKHTLGTPLSGSDSFSVVLLGDG